MYRQRVIGLLSVSLLFLAACGRSSASLETLPLTEEQASYVRQYAKPPAPSAKAAQDMQSILSSIQSIKGRIDALQKGTSPSGSASVASSDEGALPGDITASAPNKTVAKTATTKASAEESVAPSSKTNILQEISSRILNANALEAVAHQSERGLESGKKTENHLHFYKMGSQVKIEVMASSPRNAGTKLLYSVGSKRVKVRPGGALSFITTELDQKDDQIASVNNYALYQTDFIGMAKRLAEPIYSAQLIGKTTVDGQETYVAKITSSAPNTLDSRIQYEHMAYDPKTYAIRYWEAFEGTGTEPYLRYLLKSFEIKQDIPANIFKL
ncbi:MAG: hypothetical protein IV090_06770 [Candidatus Sericytochromatia bacterium]|nr:hypothetical protein [Candidatus Sericytochromatia bacterium]